MSIQEEQLQQLIDLEYDSDFIEEIKVSKQLLPDTIPEKLIDQFVEVIKQSFFQEIEVADLIKIKLESEDIIPLYTELFTLKKYLTKHDLDRFEDLGIGITNAQRIIPQLIHLLNFNDIPLIQYDVLWILGNLATLGAFDKLIIQNDGVYVIIQKLNSSYQQIALQASWTLGNITIEGDLQQICRNQVRQKGGVELILNLLNKLQDPKIIEQCFWSINNICSDGISFLRKETVNMIIQQLCICLNKFDDEILIVTCLQSLCQSIPSSQENYNVILEQKITPKLLNLIFHKNRRISLRSFELINHLIECGGEICDHILSFKFLEVVANFLKEDRSKINKINILSCILQICKGTESQQKALVENQIIVQEIFQQLQLLKNLKIKHILSSLANLALSKNKDVIIILVQNQIISHFIHFFDQLQDDELFEEMLKGLENIISVIKTQFENYNIKDLITQKEQNQILEIYQTDKFIKLRKYVDQIVLQLQ
ncbi:unnamed protein product [Paramecium sonneborni]|uniref:Importin subunit alpha n=1 Tax=Paramecium sonneborni TaxID=65129 RepID=A0A8S1M397_9CILI|nr:unnamed protein product [Paramecium sonneborni]